MTDITVRTAGNFMLLDRFSGREILPDQDNTVPHTPFIIERLATKELIVVGETDEERAVREQEEADAAEAAAAAAEEAEREAAEAAEREAAEAAEREAAEATAASEQEAADDTEAGESTPARDADGDGHDDQTGNFVEGNQAGRGRRGRSRAS